MVNRRPSTNGATSVSPAGCGTSGRAVDSRSPPFPPSATLPVGAPSTGGWGCGAPAVPPGAVGGRGPGPFPGAGRFRGALEVALGHVLVQAGPGGGAGRALGGEPGAAAFPGLLGGAGGEAQGLHGRDQRLPVVQDRREPVPCGEPLPDVVDPEVARLDVVVQLLPVQRGRHRRPRQGPQRVDAGDVGPRPVHVVVDEDLARPFGHRPGHGRPSPGRRGRPAAPPARRTPGRRSWVWVPSRGTNTCIPVAPEVLA